MVPFGGNTNVTERGREEVTWGPVAWGGTGSLGSCPEMVLVGADCSSRMRGQDKTGSLLLACHQFTAGCFHHFAVWGPGAS